MGQAVGGGRRELEQLRGLWWLMLGRRVVVGQVVDHGRDHGRVGQTLLLLGSARLADRRR